ncbi:uncharacterized protein LOC115720511 [Cannabis sativa]|uniref:uncharacterized protein LOC115720511 n=1 Tax=Cannabis sativa TaxID=3483 RepID=UPI0029CA1B18|nr:uncharacterized protein LOC115720511 [Cannabis sativa]
MKLAISLYAIKMNQQYKVKRSSSKDYSLICVDSNCKWYFPASKHGKTDMFKVRKLNDTHTCSLEIIYEDHPQATSDIIADCIKRRIINPKRNYKPNDIVEDIAEDYSISISYHKAWRAKEKATFDVKGSPYDSYNEIPGFLYMIQKCNPGTITDLVQDDEGRFKYCFFALASSIKGWNHCTPIIVVDATFLKNAYGGTLIVANAQDADRHIFPLAFAIVDSENDASWQYFMDKLKQTYGEREEQCIISDRHESIAKSVKMIFPNLMHGVCCFHLFQNIKSRFRKGGDELRDAFYCAAKAYNLANFEGFMKEIDTIDNRIRPYLTNEVGLNKWTRVYSTNKRYSTMTSIISESVNSALKEVRELPIGTLLECLRCLVQRWSWTNKNRALATLTTLAKGPEMELKDKLDRSKKLQVETSNHAIYTVNELKSSYIVDIQKKTCTCQRFQYDEMPCSHAMAVISKRHFKCYNFCSYFYTKQAFLATYEETVFPIGDRDSWELPDHIRQIEVLPPKHKRPAGRPRKQRYKTAMEKATQNQCTQCLKRGHNRRTCKNEPLEPSAKRKRY